jgi:hypothetical protein
MKPPSTTITTHQKRTLGILQLAAGTTMISFSAVFVKLAHVQPTTAGFYRMLFGGLILLAIVWFRGERLFRGIPNVLMILACSLLFALDLRGSQGSFGNAVRCIENLTGHGIRARVATAIHHRNITDLSPIHQLCSKLGVETWVLSPIQSLGRALRNWEEIKLTPHKLVETLMQIDSNFTAKTDPRVIYPLSLNSLRDRNLKPSSFVCQQDSLGNSLVIHPDGEASFCYRLQRECNLK